MLMNTLQNIFQDTTQEDRRDACFPRVETLACTRYTRSLDPRAHTSGHENTESSRYTGHKHSPCPHRQENVDTRPHENTLSGKPTRPKHSLHSNPSPHPPDNTGQNADKPRRENTKSNRYIARKG